MRGRVVLDLETRSFANLGQVGVVNYAQHHTTEIICACWQVFPPGLPPDSIEEWAPARDSTGSLVNLFNAISANYDIEAHNYSFELSMWEHCAVPKYGFPPIRREQWRDTMAAACYYALPASLDALCRALKLEGKSPEGTRLISKYSKLYLKTAKQEIPHEDLEKFIAYCRHDVELEAYVGDLLGELPEREEQVFAIDQKINLRGLYLDAEGIEIAANIVDQITAELEEKFGEITGGLRTTLTQKVMAWAAEQGFPLKNLRAAYLEDLLEGDDLPRGPAREMIEIRTQLNKASTKKLDAMLRHRTADGRARWQSRYHGAATGRWTGAGFQPLNLVRSWEDADPETLVEQVKRGSASWLTMMYGDAMEAISKAGRHWITAAPGHRIMSADFVSIEAVILACLSGEAWKVEAFQRKEFIYGITGAFIHGLDPALAANKKKFKDEYPVAAKDGKTLELACGYQGALNAWLKFDSSGRYDDATVLKYIKAWREKHPMTTALWQGLEDASLDAVSVKGKTTSYRDIGFEMVDEWLTMILPDGKRLWYRDPEIRQSWPHWHKPSENEACKEQVCKCRKGPKLFYKAMKTSQWATVSTYGGKLAENACQAVSRQYLIPSLVAVEKAGYPLIFSVYDELVVECPDGHGSLEEFLSLVRDAPGREWAKGWPIDVDGWSGQRYRK